MEIFHSCLVKLNKWSVIDHHLANWASNKVNIYTHIDTNLFNEGIKINRAFLNKQKQSKTILAAENK